MIQAILSRLQEIERRLRAFLDRLRRVEERLTAAEQAQRSSSGITAGGGGATTSFVLFRTPGGGIPARNGGTGAYGSATCTIYDDDGAKVVLGTRTDTVYNVGGVAFGATKDIIAVRIGAKYFALQEFCA